MRGARAAARAYTTRSRVIAFTFHSNRTTTLLRRVGERGVEPLGVRRENFATRAHAAVFENGVPNQPDGRWPEALASRVGGTNASINVFLNLYLLAQFKSDTSHTPKL